MKLEDKVRESNLIKNGDRIVIGVSGGPDSICLLNILVNLKDEFNLALFVVHINHSLRDEADFEDDVIQVITEPVGGMLLAQSIVYKTGEKINPSFAGIQSLCGDTFANPYLSDGFNFTLGCDGSRKAADIKDNEMIVGISKAKIEEVISGLESI